MKRIWKAIKWFVIGFVSAMIFFVNHGSLKEMIMNFFSELFYGENAEEHFKRRSYYRTPYEKYARPYQAYKRHGVSTLDNARAKAKGFLYDTDTQAYEVLKNLDITMQNYGVVTLADLIEEIELVTGEIIDTSSLDREYGWKDISEAHPIKIVKGWEIKWPLDMALEDM